MTTFTLDTNCIIALENEEPAAEAIRRLVEAHGRDGVDVALVSVSASERQRGDRYMQNYNEFIERVAAVELDRLPILGTIAYYGISFWDVGLHGRGALTGREQLIHEVLFPTIPFGWADYRKANDLDSDDINDVRAKQWRNAFCDRQMFWAHDHNKRDVFVTSDGNFRRKLEAHPSFAPVLIKTPNEAWALLAG